MIRSIFPHPECVDNHSQHSDERHFSEKDSIISLRLINTGREEVHAMTMQLQSSAFTSGDPIPVEYTGDGEDQSPPLSWDHVPENTEEFALICDDPDAPTYEPWVHWVLYKIPGDTRQLPTGLPATESLTSPAGAVQGRNSWQSGQVIGYRGPLPPEGHGVHHYHFRLYALNSELVAPPGLDKPHLIQRMKGHILDTAELIGTYQR